MSRSLTFAPPPPNRPIHHLTPPCPFPLPGQTDPPGPLRITGELVRLRKRELPTSSRLHFNWALPVPTIVLSNPHCLQALWTCKTSSLVDLLHSGAQCTRPAQDCSAFVLGRLQAFATRGGEHTDRKDEKTGPGEGGIAGELGSQEVIRRAACARNCGGKGGRGVLGVGPPRGRGREAARRSTPAPGC